MTPILRWMPSARPWHSTRRPRPSTASRCAASRAWRSIVWAGDHAGGGRLAGERGGRRTSQGRGDVRETHTSGRLPAARLARREAGRLRPCRPHLRRLVPRRGFDAAEARGRGCYRALVRARWDEAVRLGTPGLAVQAQYGTAAPILRQARVRRGRDGPHPSVGPSVGPVQPRRRLSRLRGLTASDLRAVRCPMWIRRTPSSTGGTATGAPLDPPAGRGAAGRFRPALVGWWVAGRSRRSPGWPASTRTSTSRSLRAT